MMKIANRNIDEIQMGEISRGTRKFALILTSISLLAVSLNFYQADVILGKVSVLPIYIFFFILMYMLCVIVEYISLWCERGKNFHFTSVAVHSLALILVTYELGAFYGSGSDAYSQLPHYSITSALSHVVVVPSIVDNSGI